MGPLVFAVLALTIVRMVPVALALLGTAHALRRSPSSAGSVHAAWRQSCSPSSSCKGEPIPNLHLILATISLIVILSVYAHGVSALPLTERYVAWFRNHPRSQEPGTGVDA